jgi:hypothetical protein
MRILSVAVVAMVVVGCGGGDEQGLEGGWVAEFGACLIGVNFDVGAKGYVGQFICPLDNGTVGDELEGGDADFSVHGKVTMVPRRASCLTADHSTETATFSFSGENLVMAYPQGVISFQPNKAPAGGPSAILQFGCLNAGVFERHPIQEL